MESDLVDLRQLAPSLRFDIRYATRHNFTGIPLYAQSGAYLQRPAAEALVEAHRQLGNDGYGILVYDGYRPWFVTWIFWEITPPSLRQFVANPSQGSRHNRGAAVDVGLFDRVTGLPLPMPSEYDEFSPRSHANYSEAMPEQKKNRDRLRTAMENHGFKVYEHEWWHFDFREWQRYPILNKTFEELSVKEISN